MFSVRAVAPSKGSLVKRMTPTVEENNAGRLVFETYAKYKTFTIQVGQEIGDCY